ncbi:SART-1 family protein DOT2-like [Zingiber officinale]|uniref:SART-1 family protein DOT2-like n=1 Tax=Zingiber officinale TaxID=94328 RepID=UPI001C4BE98B|nr:SART-1 family protein DOT2-like [Zingiber officinale]
MVREAASATASRSWGGRCLARQRAATSRAAGLRAASSEAATASPLRQATTGLLAVALLATSSKEQEHSQNQYTGEPQEEKAVITEVEEFVLRFPSLDTETKGDDVGWTKVEETTKAEVSDNESKDDASPDEIIHEVVGKGLSGALKLLKERDGRTMDKKKSKLIRIERTDEFGRIMTPKEAFRMLSHKFHGKGPGKIKQEKRMKQYHEDLKIKLTKASDTPLQAVEKMREAQAQHKTPYLVLSGHVKPWQKKRTIT